MDLHQYDIFEQCTQEDPITELLGSQIGRAKLPNTANPLYVPKYIPSKTCPDPINYGPRRGERYCKPNPSLSLPLSNEEYLRRKLANGGRPLSNSYLLQTAADTGKYRRTVWTEAGTSRQQSTAAGIDLSFLQLPTAPPVTGTLATAMDSGTLTMMRMAVAARGTLSLHDNNGKRFDSHNTLRHMGLAIISNPKGFGGFNQACVACDLSGTSLSTVIGQFQCTCDGPDYKLREGPFGLLWTQKSDGVCFTTPALSNDGRLLYVGSARYVYGIDTVSGNFIWYFENPFLNDNFFYSNISVGPDGTVYVGGSNSPYFFALDGLTGAMKWHYTTGDSDNYFCGKPAFNPAKTMVYVTSNGPLAAVYAFNFKGDLLYTYTNADLVSTTTLQSPCVSSAGVYISYDDHLVALTEGLAYKWTASCGNIDGLYNVDWFSPRVDSSGLVYVGSNIYSSTLYCFIDNGANATLKWSWTSPIQTIVCSPVFGPSGQVYATSNTYSYDLPPTLANAGSLVSFSSADGAVLWTYNYLSGGPGDNLNVIYATVGLRGKIYITNIVDSSLIIIRDIGSNFEYVRQITQPDADSPTYGSLCLSPPVLGLADTVYWCNGNNALPGIFAAGYTTIIESFDTAPIAPIFVPHNRTTLAAATTAPTAAAVAGPLKMQYKMGSSK